MEVWERVLAFMDAGGDVLWAVAFILFIMWALIIDRYWYIAVVAPKIHNQLIAKWQQRQDHDSWYAKSIRESWLSQARQNLYAHMQMIKTLVAICPMVGLLGTVTGMIEVFDVMAVYGTSNVRMMAAGISMATISTMAGMIAALSGVFFSAQLQSKIRASFQQLQNGINESKVIN